MKIRKNKTEYTVCAVDRIISLRVKQDEGYYETIRQTDISEIMSLTGEGNCNHNDFYPGSIMTNEPRRGKPELFAFNDNTLTIYPTPDKEYEADLMYSLITVL